MGYFFSAALEAYTYSRAVFTTVDLLEVHGDGLIIHYVRIHFTFLPRDAMQSAVMLQ